MEKNRIGLYDGKVWGIKVSKHGLENGYLDYLTLANMIGARILNNTVRAETHVDWEMMNGTFDSAIFQDYIISEMGATILYELTDEIVFYNEKLDLYVWAIDHFGTSWDYVLTDVKLIEEE